MSPATSECPPKDKKVSQSRKADKYQLLEEYKHFSWKDQQYDLSRLIGEGAKLTAVVSSIDPAQKAGGALYHRLRRLLNALVDLGLVTITGNWSYGDSLEKPGNGVQPTSTLITLTNRMQNSNHFANEIPEGWKAVVDHYLPDDAVNAKSDPCRYCSRDPAWRDHGAVSKKTQPARCRSCSRKNRKKEPESPCAKCTRKADTRDLIAVKRSRWCASCPVGITRTWTRNPCTTCSFWKNRVCTTTKTQCPYRLTVCSRNERKKAAWKLRGIDGRRGRHHWMFVRKETGSGKKIVQPALTGRLGTVQSHFMNYLEDVSKRVIILRRIDGSRKSARRSDLGITEQQAAKRDKVDHLLQDGNELVLDFQTRFTDEGRTKEEIKKFHDTWKEAGANYDGAVFLTLTSDPASNDSLWDVNRHFAPAWDTYLQLLTKRFRAKRRDELIAVLLGELKGSNPARWQRVDGERRDNQERIAGELRRLEAAAGFPDLPAAEQQARRFRIERKINPWLGLTNEEKFRVKSDLEYRTMPDGTVKRETYRPVYLAVYEFMENGLLHSHITIFGTTWIDRIDQIKSDWARLGQGAMAHAYAMHKSPAGTWEWLGKPPQDSRNRQPVDYLIKYLIKGLYTKEGHGMYWAMNKRFFTRSRSLDSGWIDYSDGQTVWQLLASLHEDNIPMSLKKQQRGAPLLKAWYDAHGDPGGAVA